MMKLPALDAPTNAKLSRKDYAKLLRRTAYLRAKEQRANDPRTIALKEEMRRRRREAYQAAKERRKVVTVEQKRSQKERRLRGGRTSTTS